MNTYSVKEEILNSITHGLGVIFGIVALTVLCVLSAYFGTITHTISYLVYGCSLILLYTSSTLYHALPSPKLKTLFKIFDHSAIYLLIAGTYTPFLILNLGHDIGFTLLAIIWALAIMGIIFKVFFTGKFKLISTLLYVGMGWLIIFAYDPLKDNLRPEGVYWLLAGGVTYTLGTVFYLAKKLKYTHAIWHMFVLAGSIFHFIAIIYGANFSY
jgi:hemolysin III